MPTILDTGIGYQQGQVVGDPCIPASGGVVSFRRPQKQNTRQDRTTATAGDETCRQKNNPTILMDVHERCHA